MSWASRRQFKYISIIFGILILILFWIFYPIIFKEPTCSDNKQNGVETGIDCGGSCMRVCEAEAYEPVVIWSRAFPVTGSIYNIVALVDNQNKNVGSEKVDYEFKIYDTNNKFIGRRTGSTFIPPNKQFAIFESRFDAGELTIRSVTFEFIPPYNWIKKDSKINSLKIFADRVIWGNDEDNPTLSARIQNDSVYDIPPFEVVAILYDVNKNAINASKTVLDGIKNNESLPLIFTWPKKLDRTSVTEDILLEINPFKVSF